MISDDLAKQLHDKATRGESLPVEQQSLLEDWYVLQDRDESGTLGLASGEKALTTLHAQVEAALIQVVAIAKQIQEVASENEALRHEITILRRQLAHQLVSQPA